MNPTSLSPGLAEHFCGHDQQLVRLADLWQIVAVAVCFILLLPVV